MGILIPPDIETVATTVSVVAVVTASFSEIVLVGWSWSIVLFSAA
jgi:hypothetical protein